MRAPLFLRAKHWHIFVPTLVIPFITMIIFLVMMAATFAISQPDGPEDLVWVFYFMPVVFILSAGTQLLWMWNVAVNLRTFIYCAERKPRVNLFRATFFLMILVLCLFPIRMAAFIGKISTGNVPDPSSIIGFILLTMLCYAVLMFSMLNNNYVVAKTLKMAELQRRVTFSDFAGDFFFLLIFPVAIWFLQPRINEVVSNELKSDGMLDTDLLD